MFDPSEINQPQDSSTAKASPTARINWLHTHIIKPYRLWSVLTFVILFIISCAGVAYTLQKQSNDAILAVKLQQLKDTNSDKSLTTLEAAPPEPKTPIDYKPIIQSKLTPLFQVDLEDLAKSWSPDKANSFELTGAFTLYGVQHLKPDGAVLAFKPNATDFNFILLLYVPTPHSDVSLMIQNLRGQIPEHINLLNGKLSPQIATAAQPYQWTITEIRPESASLPTLIYAYDSSLSDYAYVTGPNSFGLLHNTYHDPNVDKLKLLQTEYHQLKLRYESESPEQQVIDNPALQALYTEIQQLKTITNH
jgi:hypothetical protein